MGEIRTNSGLIGALSELAARVQRGRTQEDVLRIAGEGVARLGMRFVVLQIDRGDLVLRYLATAPERYEAIERMIGRRLVGLRAPIERCGPAQDIIAERRIVYRTDHDLFVRFVQAASGCDPLPLDTSPGTAGISKGVVSPLFVREEPWGLISLLSSSIEPEDAAAVALFATHLGSAFEVTEFIQTLRETQDALVARERLATIGELAATVAHEVRNPLGVLFNSVASLRRLLQKDVTTEARSDTELLLSVITEESERLNAIVTDLLELARPWAMRTEETSLTKVVRMVANDVARLPEPGASINVQLDLADLPLVEIDPRMLRQALLNLVINAVQAMPKGGALRIVTRVEYRDEIPFACVAVTDTGVGITREDQPHIHNPFFSTKQSGTGLGLVLVNRVVEAHRGELGMVSDTTGTTFTLRIPLRHIESSSDAVPSSLVISRPPLREPRSVPAFGGSATTTEPRFKTV